MREFIWIVLCLFASIGLAQCVAWLGSLRRPPRGFRAGYHLIPLYDDPASIEAQLRHSLAALSWNRAETRAVLLVDMGLGDECAAICARFIRENPGLVLCSPDTLSDTLLSF